MRTPTRLSDWPWVEVRVSCSMCPRTGCYRLARLAAQFGAEMDMARLLAVLARDCPHWNSRPARKYEPRCGARYADADVAMPKIEQPKGYAQPYDGPPADIADSKKHGIEAVIIECAGVYCHRQKRFTFDELGLPDDVFFNDIPKHFRFRCERCGSRKVTVHADWPNRIERFQKRMREP